MNENPHEYPKIPPFHVSQRKTTGGDKMRGIINLTLLIFNTGMIGTALLGGAVLAWSILERGLRQSLKNDFNGLIAALLALGLAFAVGWVFSLLSIRGFGSLLMPYIVQLYTWGTLAGICVIQVFILLKLFEQNYTDTQYLAYMLLIAGGMTILVGLHLIIEDHDLRPFSIPLLLINVLHIFLIVIRYVFMPEADPTKLVYDLFFFATGTITAGLMLSHLGILAPLRKKIKQLFSAEAHYL